MSIRVLLVDDHAVLRAGLRMLLEEHAEIDVAGEASGGSEALEFLGREGVDVVLLDLMLRGETALDVLPRIPATSPRARVIILTGCIDPLMHRKAIELGAHGLVLKDDAFHVLFKAIQRVHEGEIWVDRTLMAEIIAGFSSTRQKDDPEAEKIASLSPREKQIIALIGEGLKNKAISQRLFLSETTVRHHLTSVFQKLQVNDRLELVIYAYRHNLCSIKTEDE